MPKYEIEVRKFSELKNKIEIPKFQRGLVWSKTKKKEFIKSLKAGLPIGVLLLSRKDDKYLIVDGLQRFTTMLDYAKNYFSYIEASEITDTDLITVIYASETARDIFDQYPTTAKGRILNEMREIIATHISHGHEKNLFDLSSDATDELCRKTACLSNSNKFPVASAVYQIASRIHGQASINDITIPLIIFTGSSDELANIFQKLNQEGVKLSKYDVFAATWINHHVTVRNDPAFVDYITKKYEKAQEQSDLDIESYDPDEMKRTGILTVFEYAFAVGKALMDRCKRLFPKMDDAKVDSIGFLLLAELMGLTYQDMGNLADTMKKYRTLDFKKLKDCILECGEFVERTLASWIESPTGNSKKRISLACHSELQLASYIITVFKLKYDLSSESGLVQHLHKRELDRVKQFLPRHYLYDILRGYWSGSGDSKLEEIIAAPTICRYTKDVDRGDFERTVENWLSDGNRKAEIKNVSAETKLFLNYLLRVSVPDAFMHSYDVEHCVPKDVLKKYYSERGCVVPVSSPCNLVFIPSSDNRAKGELTYYQRQDQEPDTFKLDHQALDRLGYPSRSELRFVESTSTLTEENYFAYLNQRKKDILHKFITTLYS